MRPTFDKEYMLLPEEIKTIATPAVFKMFVFVFVFETFLNELWHKKHFCCGFQLATAFSHVFFRVVVEANYRPNYQAQRLECLCIYYFIYG